MEGSTVRRRQAELYAGGEYSALSTTLLPAAQELVAGARLEPGHVVLDVGAGDGGVAASAAAIAGPVVSVDLSLAQVARGQRRTAALEGTFPWVAGDAQRLPFQGRVFDRALSSFGAVYAPDPFSTAAELCRVCRHGGLVALTAWPPDSLMGELAAALRDRVPDFPDVDHGWGIPSKAEQFLAGCAEVTATSRRTLTVDPQVRGAAGVTDCADVFLAKHLTVGEIRDLRQSVGAPYLQRDGTLRSDYVIVVADVR